jgi:peptidoglycan/LPS O-acetylase OafA/YrhL
LIRDLFGQEFLDGVAWTLEIEIKFYIVCALLAPWLRERALGVLVVPVILVMVAGLLGHMSIAVFPYLAKTAEVSSLFIAFMFIGTGFYFHLHRELGLCALALLGAFILAAFTLTWITATGAGRFHMALAYGLAVAAFTLSFVFRAHFRPLWLTQYISAISYPIYVVHLALALGIFRFTVLLGMPPLVAALAALTGVVTVATALHIVIEAPTHRLGQSLARPSSKARLRMLVE